MKIDDNLSNVFDIEPLERTVYDIAPAQLSQSDMPVADDLDTARSNLHDIIHTGKDALLHALDLAKQSEHPRAFEVVGSLMKQLADINEQLLNLHLKKQKLDDSNINALTNSGQQVVNNALFVGSTAELSKFLQTMNTGTL